LLATKPAIRPNTIQARIDIFNLLPAVKSLIPIAAA